MIGPWGGQAFNQVPDSENQIHGDELAQQYGFKGGLVPGVTVSAYLIHPAVESWGLGWLSRGTAWVRVTSPLYDEDSFAVRIGSQSESAYTAQLLGSDGTVRASAEVALVEVTGEPPRRRGDPIGEPGFVGPAASFAQFERLQQQGCLAFRYAWAGTDKLATYLRDESAMPALLQQGSGGYANMSFILGCSNWMLASNAYMNPWVHLETRSTNFRSIPADTAIVGEMRIVDFYEKKGHEFVDVDVSLFDEMDDACLSTIKLRAIYKLRAAS